jgi:hypothetical protein
LRYRARPRGGALERCRAANPAAIHIAKASASWRTPHARSADRAEPRRAWQADRQEWAGWYAAAPPHGFSGTNGPDVPRSFRLPGDARGRSIRSALPTSTQKYQARWEALWSRRPPRSRDGQGKHPLPDVAHGETAIAALPPRWRDLPYSRSSKQGYFVWGIPDRARGARRDLPEPDKQRPELSPGNSWMRGRPFSWRRIPKCEPRVRPEGRLAQGPRISRRTRVAVASR